MQRFKTLDKEEKQIDAIRSDIRQNQLEKEKRIKDESEGDGDEDMESDEGEVG